MTFKNLDHEFYINAYHFTQSNNKEYSIYFLGEYHGSLKVLDENTAEHYSNYDGKTKIINTLDRFF